jgi:predicted Fe-Mo cluster-binding NifX family protein
MKLIVTTLGPTLNDAVDPRFGRAKHFLLVDTETSQAIAHPNEQNLQAAQGAGIQAAQAVVTLGAEAVITGNVGPKAFRVLTAGGIKVYLSQGGTAAEALDQFKKGLLRLAEAASVEGHWS